MQGREGAPTAAEIRARADALEDGVAVCPTVEITLGAVDEITPLGAELFHVFLPGSRQCHIRSLTLGRHLYGESLVAKGIDERRRDARLTVHHRQHQLIPT